MNGAPSVLRVVLLAVLWAPLLFPADIRTLVAQVSQPNYTHLLRNLLYTRSGDNRGPQGAQLGPARTAIFQAFQRLGLETTLDPFTHLGVTYYNVSGLLRGKTRPDEYIVIGAHFDSKNNAGADDNASGVAAVLEAARVASLHDFESSILFLAFDQEEQGLLGSKAWVQNHPDKWVRGMVSLDMIAFNPPGNTWNLVAVCVPNDTFNSTLANFRAAIDDYSGGLTSVYGGVATGSDHSSFARTAPSVLAIEASFKANLHYHKVTDTVETPGNIDFAYATGVTRSTVGYLAAQAGLAAAPALASTTNLRAGAVLNAASTVAGFAAPSQLLTLYGTGFAEGVRVTVRSGTGEEQPAFITYRSGSQINLVMPDRVPPGPATLQLDAPDGARVQASIAVHSTAPGVFTAAMTGAGPAAAHGVLARPDGAQSLQPLFQCAAGGTSCAAAPIDFGVEGDRAVLILYGTGIRGRAGLDGVRLELAGQKLPVQYAGAHSVYPGLDQVNVEIPRSLRGRGLVEALLWVDGIAANPFDIRLGP